MNKLGSRRLRRGRVHLLVSAGGALLVAAVVGGCARVGDGTLAATTTSSVASPVTESGGGAGTSYEVEDLGLRFELPQSYEAVDGEDLVFLRPELRPPSIFSIDGAESGVAHEPEAGESVSETRLGEVDAQVSLPDRGPCPRCGTHGAMRSGNA